MAQLGVEMIPAYFPEARGRSERAFATHQDSLVKELAAEGVATMAADNRYLKDVYRAAFNQEFNRPPREAGTAFVPLMGIQLDKILCENFERTVGNNSGSFENLRLPIPQTRDRIRYRKLKVRAHRYPDRSLALFHAPRLLTRFTPEGKSLDQTVKAAA